MSFRFIIRNNDEVEVKEPTVGTWYCGFNYDKDYCSGLIGMYVGNGEFYDGDDEVDMRDYDYLVEQV